MTLMKMRPPPLYSSNEARIAALERLVGKQALELAVKSGPQPKSVTTCAIVGPRALASQKDAADGNFPRLLLRGPNQLWVADIPTS